MWGLAGEKLPKQGMFPLKAVMVYVGEDKLSLDMSKYVRFWVQKHMAKELFAKLCILEEGQFEEVEWGMVWGGAKRGAKNVPDLGKQTSNEYSWGKQKSGEILITSEQEVPKL